jgi:hypothetical protein
MSIDIGSKLNNSYDDEFSLQKLQNEYIDNDVKHVDDQNSRNNYLQKYFSNN